MTSSSLASAAFQLALKRKAIFALSPGSKIPLAGTHGHLDASIDADVCRVRWKKNPTANIGIATGSRSGFWAIDVDPIHGGDKTLQSLIEEHGELPTTVSVKTPSGGIHMWWSWSDDPPVIRNSAGRIGPGIDVRGEGGYVIAPPSVLSDGRSYQWIGKSKPDDPLEIVAAPGWLTELALPPPPPERTDPVRPTEDLVRYVKASLEAELYRLENAGAGSRNDVLNRASFNVGQFVGAGAVPEAWATSSLRGNAPYWITDRFPDSPTTWWWCLGAI